jgi:hypothetical protein
LREDAQHYNLVARPVATVLLADAPPPVLKALTVELPDADFAVGIVLPSEMETAVLL